MAKRELPRWNRTFEVSSLASRGDVMVVEWNSDYGDGRVYRNVSIGEMSKGEVVRVTDYWGEPFNPPEWRRGLSDSEDVRPHVDELTED